MRNYAEGISHAMQKGETVNKLPKAPDDERKAILDLANEFEPDWFVIDLPYPDMDTSYFSVLREKGVKICFIDDFRFINPGADVILNSSILAQGKTKKPREETTRYFLGPQFLIFDESLVNSAPIRKEGMFNVVLTFGASDPTDLTKKVLKALLGEDWAELVVFRVILGPGYADVDLVKFLVQGREQNFEVVINVPEIIPFFQGCDLAVCAGGRTMYELFHLNKRFVPIATTEHEAAAVGEFVRQGFTDFGLTAYNSHALIKHLKTVIP